MMNCLKQTFAVTLLLHVSSLGMAFVFPPIFDVTSWLPDDWNTKGCPSSCRCSFDSASCSKPLPEDEGPLPQNIQSLELINLTPDEVSRYISHTPGLESIILKETTSDVIIGETVEVESAPNVEISSPPQLLPCSCKLLHVWNKIDSPGMTISDCLKEGFPSDTFTLGEFQNICTERQESKTSTPTVQGPELNEIFDKGVENSNSTHEVFPRKEAHRKKRSIGRVARQIEDSVEGIEGKITEDDPEKTYSEGRREGGLLEGQEMKNEDEGARIHKEDGAGEANNAHAQALARNKAQRERLRQEAMKKRAEERERRLQEKAERERLREEEKRRREEEKEKGLGEAEADRLIQEEPRKTEEETEGKLNEKAEQKSFGEEKVPVDEENAEEENNSDEQGLSQNKAQRERLRQEAMKKRAEERERRLQEKAERERLREEEKRRKEEEKEKGLEEEAEADRLIEEEPRMTEGEVEGKLNEKAEQKSFGEENVPVDEENAEESNNPDEQGLSQNKAQRERLRQEAMKKRAEERERRLQEKAERERLREEEPRKTEEEREGRLNEKAEQDRLGEEKVPDDEDAEEENNPDEQGLAKNKARRERLRQEAMKKRAEERERRLQEKTERERLREEEKRRREEEKERALQEKAELDRLREEERIRETEEDEEVEGEEEDNETYEAALEEYAQAAEDESEDQMGNINVENEENVVDTDQASIGMGGIAFGAGSEAEENEENISPSGESGLSDESIAIEHDLQNGEREMEEVSELEGDEGQEGEELLDTEISVDHEYEQQSGDLGEDEGVEEEELGEIGGLDNSFVQESVDNEEESNEYFEDHTETKAHGDQGYEFATDEVSEGFALENSEEESAQEQHPVGQEGEEEEGHEEEEDEEGEEGAVVEEFKEEDFSNTAVDYLKDFPEPVKEIVEKGMLDELTHIDEEVLEHLKEFLSTTKVDLPVDINDPYDLGLLLRHLRHHSSLLANIDNPKIREQILDAMQETDLDTA